MTELAPVTARERLVTLDILRGFALLGVLLGNIAHLYSGHFVVGGPSETMADDVSRWFISLVVQSKAQTLLTFLFGFGFAAQLLRAQQRNEPVLGLYTRRLLALLGFGLLHVFLLSWVDVLWTYAVAGFLLLAFLRVPNRAKVVLGLAFVFVPSAIYWLPDVAERVQSLLFDDPKERFKVFQAAYDAMRGTEHLETLRTGWRVPIAFIAGFWPQYFLWLLGHFLLGYVVGARRWFDRDGADHLVAFRKLLVAGLILGAAGTTWQVLLFARVLPHDLGTAGSLAGGALFEADFFGLALVGIAAVVLLAQRPAWKRALSIVAPVGRMPLTTYLSQSLICTFVIDGWGLGWIEWLSEVGYIGLGLAVFAVQLVISHVWLRYFRFGPLEWLWRTIVYLRAPPMRV